MRLKRYLARSLTRVGYHLRSLGFLAAIPLLVLDLLIPCLNIMDYIVYGAGDELRWNILQYSQWLMPFFSVWWALFVLREYIEGDGNELLYVYGGRCRLPDALWLFALPLLNILLLFLCYTLVLPSMKYEFLRLLTICVFYFGVMYFLSYAAKSITITLMALLLYTIANAALVGNAAFPFYVSFDDLSAGLYYRQYLPLLLSGLALLTAGVFFNKRYCRFN